MLSICDTDLDKESLQKASNYKVEQEDYKSACILRDLINEL
jgi:protein-arginine kinase activator protein McsA